MRIEWHPLLDPDGDERGGPVYDVELDYMPPTAPRSYGHIDDWDDGDGGYCEIYDVRLGDRSVYGTLTAEQIKDLKACVEWEWYHGCLAGGDI